MKLKSNEYLQQEKRIFFLKKNSTNILTNKKWIISIWEGIFIYNTYLLICGECFVNTLGGCNGSGLVRQCHVLLCFDT